MIHRTIGRRIETLERSRRPMRTGPAFVMATSHVAAQQQIERLRRYLLPSPHVTISFPVSLPSTEPECVTAAILAWM